MKFKWLSILLSGIFVLLGLAYLNIVIIPVQKQEAVVYGYEHYQCGNDLIGLNPTESPSCSAGITTLGSFSSNVQFHVESGNSNYTLVWKWANFFCPTPSSTPCYNPASNPVSQGSQTIGPGQDVNASTGTVAPPSPFSACGQYQMDLAFQVYSGSTLICAHGNINDPAHDNANFAWCTSGVTCTVPATHKACVNQSCQVQSGAGSDQCNTDNDCVPQTHLACQGMACVSTAGPGANSCTQNSDCQHLACQNNACVETAGTGANQCTTNPNSCAPQTHMACQDMACVSVSGPGANSCSQDSDCFHNACQNNACVKQSGGGTSTCSTDSDCAVQHHLTCVNNACVSVTGTGTDTCSSNADCGHKTCVNNACVVVSGIGTDTCQSSSDCITPSPSPTPELKVIKVVENNHGGTKTPADFILRVNGTQVTNNATNAETPGDYVVSEDTMSGYHQVSISGDCDATGHVHLDNGDNKTCVIENEDNGSAPCTMPVCSTSVAGCSFPSPDTQSCSCGPLVCITQTPSQNVTINNNITNTQSQNQQQQQQQSVLGASVAPAPTSTSLPSTGAGADVLFTLLGLLPVGLKLRRLV